MITETQNYNTQIQTKNSLEIRFRCPHCQKLYRTGADVFEGDHPEFDCVSCSKSFRLTDKKDDFGLFVTALPEQYLFEPCPKCSNLKPLKQDECPSCGVYAEKYLQLQKVESPRLYDLNQLWQAVVANFHEDRYHQDFLNRCHHNMALNFAFQKYSELQKTIGFDVLCEKYIKQIELRIEQQLQSPKYNKDLQTNLSSGFGFSAFQVTFMGLGLFGLAMLIYNKFVPTFPNFNGFVLSLALIFFAVGLFSDSGSNRPKQTSS